MADHMRVAVIEAPGKVRLATAPLPEPGPGQVRVRLEGSGVCASNLALWEGRPWFRYPAEGGAPGHEGWGRVDALGDGVSGIARGDRVAMISYRAYADYDLADAAHVVRLPDALGDAPFPGECLACAMNILRRSRIAKGEQVAVVGVGFLGAMLTRLAHAAGARVIALSRRPFARATARDMGAAETLPIDDIDASTAEVMRLTGGRGCGCVIEAAGLQYTLDLAGKLVAERGRLVIAGYHQDSPRTVDMQLWNWRGIDVINAHERDPLVYVGGMRRALDAVLIGEVDPLPLYTHTFPLAALGDALDAVAARPEGLLKALVTT